MNAARHYYPQLTGVRALAAYLIFLHHFPTKSLGEAAFAIQRELHIGVPIFFVLSGFLIYLRYSESCRLERGWLGSYFKNRFARIYPVFFLVILFQCYLMKSGWFDFLMQATFIKGFSGEYKFLGLAQGYLMKSGWFDFLMQVTFIKGFSGEYKFLGLAQGWTLTVEETFYCLFPLLLICMKRTGFLVAWLAVYGVGFSLFKGGTWLDWHGFFTPERFMLYYTFFGQASQFFVGMLLAKWIVSSRVNSIEENLPGRLTWLGIGGIVFCVFCFYQLRAPTFALGLFAPWGIFINHTLLPCSIALFFYGLLTEQSWVRSALQSKQMVLLGKSSYIFYLIHMTFYFLIATSISSKKLIIFILLNILSVFFYFTIERPCQKWIVNFRWKSVKRLFALPRQEENIG